jgi:hypothetical protein
MPKHAIMNDKFGVYENIKDDLMIKKTPAVTIVAE